MRNTRLCLQHSRKCEEKHSVHSSNTGQMSCSTHTRHQTEPRAGKITYLLSVAEDLVHRTIGL